MHLRDLMEPEETVGNLWHDIASGIGAGVTYPGAGVTLASVRPSLAVLFRALGGAPGVELDAVAPSVAQHRQVLRRKLGADFVPVEPVFRCPIGIANAGEASLMRETLSEGEVAFALGGELRPIAAHGGIIVEITTFHAERNNERGDRLAGGEDGDQIIGSKSGAAPAIFIAAGELHEGLAVFIDAELRANFEIICEIGPKGIGHRAEPVGDI